ncbi:MAG: hypothetical protein KDJ80_09010 [Nitratireductor sp.]|nr:hypothetical protein [Nitratireductor sp.]
MLWEMTVNQWLTSFAVVCCLSYLGGWVADRILGYAGFTAIGNWLLMLAGTYTGLLAYNMLGYRFFWNTQSTMILAVGSAFAMLFIMLSAKAVLRFR